MEPTLDKNFKIPAEIVLNDIDEIKEQENLIVRKETKIMFET